MNQTPVESPAGPSHGGELHASGRAVIYVVAFVTGGIVMSFEMLGSRYLNPYFGSGIYTWAALISTVLIAPDRRLLPRRQRWPTAPPRRPILALTVMIASLYLLALPTLRPRHPRIRARRSRRYPRRQPGRRRSP